MSRADENIPGEFEDLPREAAVSEEFASQRASSRKWGIASDGGFQIVPDLILRRQKELKLTPNDIVVLLNLTMAWWEVNRPPFTRPSTIAGRMGVSERTIQRSLARLVKLGLIEKVKMSVSGDDWSAAYDLKPLVERLKYLAANDMISMRRRSIRDGAAGVQTQ